MFGLGTTELLVIGVIVFLIFGAKRIPDIGKGIGGAIREFRKVKKDIALEESDEKSGEEKAEDRNDASGMEERLKEKVMGEIPGVGQVMAAKKKIEKVKALIK